MPARLSWTEAATFDLINEVRHIHVIHEIVINAENTLHDVFTVTQDEGVEGSVMWHRGFSHEQEELLNKGLLSHDYRPAPWDFFLFYRLRRPLMANFPRYVVLHVESVTSCAGRYMRIASGLVETF